MYHPSFWIDVSVLIHDLLYQIGADPVPAAATKGMGHIMLDRRHVILSILDNHVAVYLVEGIHCHGVLCHV